MTNEKKGNGKGLVVGVFAGLAIGSIISLLFAPKSGKKLRSDIKTKSRDLAEDAEKYMLNVNKKTSLLINDLKKNSCCWLMKLKKMI